MLGVAMNRQCPDQVASEKAREAYVANRLAVAEPVVKSAKPKVNLKKQAAQQARGGRTSER